MHISKPPLGQTFLIGVITLIFALPLLSIAAHLLAGGVWPDTLSLYVLNTVLLMGAVGIISALIGVGCAWLICAYDFPGRKWLSLALVLPIAAPAYIIAYVYADFLEFYGPVQSSLRAMFGWEQSDYSFPSIRNLPGAALMLSFVLYPYIYLLARASFLTQSQSQWWAARNLGLGARQAFFKIVLPTARPAIAGGTALVMMETLADFGVADFFAVQTFSVGIFRNWLIIGDKPAAMKLASVMLLVIILLITLEASTRRGSVANNDKTFGKVAPDRLMGWRAFAAMLACFIPVLIGLLIPVLRLVYFAIFEGDALALSPLAAYAKNSFLLAIIVGVLALGIAVFLAYRNRTHPSAVLRSSIRLSTLGYALPGALLAVGLLSPLAWLDQRFSRMIGSLMGASTGLIITGTIIALVYALCVRFLTVAFNTIDAGFSKIPASMEHASRSLGAHGFRRMRTVFLPLLRPSLTSAFILVFIDVMRELPATLIMRPFNFDTLATRVYWLASDERLSEASTAALIIIVIGILPTLYLNAFVTKQGKA